MKRLLLSFAFMGIITMNCVFAQSPPNCNRNFNNTFLLNGIGRESEVFFEKSTTLTTASRNTQLGEMSPISSFTIPGKSPSTIAYIFRMCKSAPYEYYYYPCSFSLNNPNGAIIIGEQTSIYINAGDWINGEWYVLGFFGHIHKVNPTNGACTFVTWLTLATWDDLTSGFAHHNTDNETYATLSGSTSNTPSYFYTINLNTGEMSYKFSPGIFIYDFVITNDGRFIGLHSYFNTNHSSIVEINPATGAYTTLFTLPFFSWLDQSMAYDREDDMIYLACRNNATDDFPFCSFNPTNNQFNIIGYLPCNGVGFAIPPPIPTLTGTPTISGSPIFGQTLTAVTTGLSSTPLVTLGTLSYQWKRGGVNIGTNSATYTLVQADIGSTITVTVTAANCTGEVSSLPTATVTKATPTAPAAPTLLSKTAQSITLNTVNGCEYSINNGAAWQDQTLFSGLTPNTSYSFTQRLKETTTHFASLSSTAASFTTDYMLVQADIGGYIFVTVCAENCNESECVFNITQTPVTKATQQAPPTPTLNNATASSITLNTVSGCEYKRSGGTWQTLPIFSGLTPNTSYSFTQRKAETTTHLASPASATAQFNTVQTYTITASVNNTNWGTITPVGECVVEDGKSITFSITPTESGKLEDVKVNGASKGAISFYTFENVKANGTIEALFIENVGITENSIGNIHIHPNPTTGELTIDNGQLTITSVEVYDVIGKKVFTSSVSQMSTETVHNISHLQKGLYFVKIQTEAGEVVRKILKE